MLITAIVAQSLNGVIGKQNQLPWHLPADLRHFKTLTMGKPMIMGRKTYESIGRPLPGRTSIVLSNSAASGSQGQVHWVNTPAQALQVAREQATPEVFIIGGGEVFQLFWPLLHRLHLTLVKAEVEGDVFFPFPHSSEWAEVSRTAHPADDKHLHAYDFIMYQRKA